MSPPSSTPPGVPPSGGNAKYAIVALLLLFGIGGLFAIRAFSGGSKPAPLPPLPSASVAQTAEPPPNPKLEDIPPPPPPEEKPSASPATGPHVAYVPTGGCDGRCSEKFSTPELGQALAVRQSQARRCYNQALARDPSLKGRVSLAVRIGPSGNVCSVGVESNDMGTPAVAQCAANIFRNASYPAPKGGCVDANVPLKFVPQGESQ